MDAARRKHTRSTSSTLFTISDSADKGCYNQILSLLRAYLRRGYRRTKRYLKRKYKERKQKRSSRHGENDAAVHFHHHHHHHIHHHHLHLCSSNMSNTTCHNNGSTSSESTAPNNGAQSILPPPAITIDEVNEEKLSPLPPLPINTTTALLIPDTTVVICPPNPLPVTIENSRKSATLSFIPSVSSYRNSESYRSVGDPSLCEQDLTDEEVQQLEREVTDCEISSGNEVRRRKPKKAKKVTKLDRFQKEIVHCCEHNVFKIIIMTAIFLNTVIMAIEHHKQVD